MRVAPLSSLAPAALALAVLGCEAGVPEPVFLEISSPAGTQATRLEIWAKREGPAVGASRRVMTPDGVGRALEIGAGRDLALDPLVVRLQPDAGQGGGALYVHVVARAGARPMALGDVRVPIEGSLEPVALHLTPWRLDCDRDGDSFSDCGVPGCCDHIEPEIRDRFADCLDDPDTVDGFRGDLQCRRIAGTSVDVARSTHPFRPTSFGAALERCDDCIDQDCAGGDQPCDFPDADGDGASPPYDCDDDDDRRAPGMEERCNAVDDDCDGAQDEDFDEDGDGVTTCAGDCDDADPAVHPGASQICGDGIDQTCEVTEGPIDDPCASADLDGDGWPAPPAGTDCDDRDAGVHPGARERCGDGVDQDCQQGDLACPPTDEDGDGHGSQAQGGADCDDGDRRTYPGAPDKCGDGVDQDCDGHDPGCGEDQDGDGYLAGAGDCDDDDRTVFPWATERCNGQDDDCDGEVDEGNPLSLRGEASPSEDCYDGPQGTEGVGACRPGARTCTRPEGASVLICLGQVLPRPETCANEGDDDDCSGVVDDVPGRGGDCDTGDAGACAAGALGCHRGELSCVAHAMAEPDLACDGVDRDCDGKGDADEFLEAWHTRACFTGPGMPGVGGCVAGTHSCTGPTHGACVGEVSAVEETCANPGVDDDCNGVDDDVAGLNDDCDSGARGACAAGRRRCDGGELRCVQTVTPEQETCDGVDDDCDGDVDEDFPMDGQACAVQGELGERCDEGRWACANGAPICEPVFRDEPGADGTCDGVDDDCDDDLDEDWEHRGECESGSLGRCRRGHWECFADQGERCVPRHEPRDERCDNDEDDDCDGLDDDDDPDCDD